MKQINAFQASDGTLFVLQEEAARHEVALSKRDIIENYLDSTLNPYVGLAQRGVARVAVINWEFWKAQNEIIPK